MMWWNSTSVGSRQIVGFFGSLPWTVIGHFGSKTYAESSVYPKTRTQSTIIDVLHRVVHHYTKPSRARTTKAFCLSIYCFLNNHKKKKEYGRVKKKSISRIYTEFAYQMVFINQLGSINLNMASSLVLLQLGYIFHLWLTVLCDTTIL
jgi:hypothetical protein